MAGLRDYGGRFSFQPHKQVRELRFHLTVRGQLLDVEMTADLRQAGQMDDLEQTIDGAVDGNGTLRASTVVTVSAIVIALIKVRIIFREFMEVRHAPALLCRLTDGWVVLIGVCLLGSYFVGSAIAG